MIFLTACSENIPADQGVIGNDVPVQINMETEAETVKPAENIDKSSNTELTALKDEIAMMMKNGNSPRDIINYINNALLTVTPETEQELNDQIFRDLIVYMQNFKGKYQELIQNAVVDQILYELGSPVRIEAIEGLSEGDVKSLLMDITMGGYKIADQGEYFDVKLDYTKLHDMSRNVQGPARDYIELQYYSDLFFERLTSRSPVNMDEFVSMIIRAEDHLARWPESPFKAEINALYKNQTIMYYLGSLDYEVFDFNSNRLNPERLDLMKKHMQMYSESAFAELGIKYLLALESYDYAYHPEYIQLVENYKRFGLRSNLKLVEKMTMDHSKSVFLPELQGHDNLTIQESINGILRDEVTAAKAATGFVDDTEGTFYFNTYIYMSNESILSMECLGAHNMKDWTRDQSVSSTLTFDIATGEPLTLDRFLNQDVNTIDGWLLPVVNNEIEKYFGSEFLFDTLENTKFVVSKESLLIIGDDSTHRAYIPLWKLNEYVKWKTLIE